MIRPVALVSAVLLILAGCTGGRQVPPTAVPAPAEPQAEASASGRPVAVEPAASTPSAPINPCLDQTEAHDYGQVNDHYVINGICRAVVDSDDVWVYLTFDVGVSIEAARAALSVAAPTQPEVLVYETQEPNEGFWIRLHFPPGQPGDRIQVHIKDLPDNIGAPLNFGFDLERVPTPAVGVESRDADGAWRPLDRIASLPRGATDLRFQITGAVPAAGVEAILQRNQIPAGEWKDGVSTVRTLTEPPGHIFLDLDGLPSDDGLRTAHSIWEIFFGAPPQLVAIDLATGAEQAIGRAPLNAAESSRAPDGTWVAFFTVHPEVPWAEEAWVMNTVSGALVRLGTKTNWPFIRAYWSGSELMVTEGDSLAHWRPGAAAVDRVAVQSADFPAMSPDGRYLAGFTYDWSREDEHFLTPGTILLYDVVVQKERPLAVDQVKVRIPHSEFPAYLLMEFTPDGKGLMIREPLPVDGGADHWVRLDLDTQALTEVPEFQPAPARTGWLSGPGGYQAQGTDGYKPVSVKAPDGSVKSYGEGLVVGWRQDGRLLVVRWENGKDLRRAWNGT